MPVAKLLAVLFVCAFVAGPILAAEPAPGIEKLMTPEQFKRTGLYKLTPEELDVLNKWLNGDAAQDTVAPARPAGAASAPPPAAAAPAAPSPAVTQSPAEKNFGKPVPESQLESIASQIDGAFSGWTGKTVFRLKNGQVWQQRIDGRLNVHEVNPKVEIKRNLLGFYVLYLVGTNHAVGVKRIQ